MRLTFSLGYIVAALSEDVPGTVGRPGRTGWPAGKIHRVTTYLDVFVVFK